jgi:hypothetical protein
VELSGVRLQRVGRGAQAQQSPDLRQWMYRVAWQPQPLAPPDKSPTAAGRWLIFADRQGVGLSLAKILHPSADGNGSIVIVQPGEQFISETPDHYRIDPRSAEDYRRLLDEVLDHGKQPLTGIVHLWSLDDSPSQESPQSLGSVLQLVKQLARAKAAAAATMAATAPSNWGPRRDLASAIIGGFGLEKRGSTAQFVGRAGRSLQHVGCRERPWIG